MHEGALAELDRPAGHIEPFVCGAALGEALLDGALLKQLFCEIPQLVSAQRLQRWRQLLPLLVQPRHTRYGERVARLCLHGDGRDQVRSEVVQGLPGGPNVGRPIKQQASSVRMYPLSSDPLCRWP